MVLKGITEFKKVTEPEMFSEDSFRRLIKDPLGKIKQYTEEELREKRLDGFAKKKWYKRAYEQGKGVGV